MINIILNYEGSFICRNGVISKKIPKNDIRYKVFSRFEFNLDIGLRLRHNVSLETAKSAIILLRIRKNFADYENQLDASHYVCI